MNLVEQVDVPCRGAAGLWKVGDMLAEDIHRREKAHIVQLGCDAERVCRSLAGDVTLGKLVAYGLGDDRECGSNCSIKERHKRILQTSMKKVVIVFLFVAVFAAQAISDAPVKESEFTFARVQFNMKVSGLY